MSQFEAVFTSTTGPVCRICETKVLGIKVRSHHVLQHVSTDADIKIHTCKKCDFSDSRLSRMEIHVRKHIKDKTKKYDLKEIHKYIESHKKKNEKIISEMGMACFGSQMEIVRVLPSNGQLSNAVKTQLEMSQFEAVFTSTTGLVCQICETKVFAIKVRSHHVLQHVSTDADIKIHTCKRCDFSDSRLSIMEQHVRNHINDKTKKYDLTEVHKYIENHKKENEKIISEMGMACFGSQMEIVRRTIVGRQSTVVETENTNDDHEKEAENVQDVVPMEETETAEPQRLEMTEPTPVRAMLLPTIKDEQVYKQLNQVRPVVVLGRNVKNECHWIDLNDDNFDEVRQNHELEVVLEDQVDKNGGLVPAPLAASATPEVFMNYRLQKKWDTEELIANMRAVGRILEFSRNVIDTSIDVLRENMMDGALVSYQDENLTDFFKNCPVVYGVRIAIIKMLQAMGLKDING